MINRMKIDELHLTTRARKCLLKEFGNDATIADILNARNWIMRTMPHFGRKSYDDLKQVLRDLGIDYNQTWDDLRRATKEQ